VARTKLQLEPARTEGQTRFAITGSLPDGLPKFALHQLLAQLSYWTGERIDAVLYADGPAGWVEVWSDALADAPVRHLRVRFELEDRGE
jgi:hypothetical protein